MPDYKQLMSQTDQLLGKLQNLEQTCQQTKDSLTQARQESANLQAATTILQFIGNEIAKETEEDTAKLLTLALQETFYDQNLKLEVIRDTYRGHPGVVFQLVDELKGARGDPMESFGGGPASLLGILLQVLSTIRQPQMDRILILDEPIVQVSELYHQAAGRMIRRLCEPPPLGLGFKILMVTHSESLAEQAHKRYIVGMTEEGALTLTLAEQGDESG